MISKKTLESLMILCLCLIVFNFMEDIFKSGNKMRRLLLYIIQRFKLRDFINLTKISLTETLIGYMPHLI